LKVKIKICGINDEKSAFASIDADYIGLVFFDKSPRCISSNLAKRIIRRLNGGPKKVGLFVNQKIDSVERISKDVGLDIIQLHGDEDVRYVSDLKKIINKPIIKAVPIKTKEDINISQEFKNFCDMILFDTKSDNNLFGGTGLSFDWELLNGFKSSKEWIIAGGLNKSNIEKAIKITNAPIVDLSSGVEKEVGLKCENKIKELIKYVKNL
jgi:phosphoribosylanthranilate isomerase